MWVAVLITTAHKKRLHSYPTRKMYMQSGSNKQESLLTVAHVARARTHTQSLWPTRLHQLGQCGSDEVASSLKHHTIKTHGKWRYTSMHSQPHNSRQVSGEVCAPPALRARNIGPRSLDGPQSQSGALRRSELSTPGIESHSTVQTSVYQPFCHGENHKVIFIPQGTSRKQRSSRQRAETTELPDKNNGDALRATYSYGVFFTALQNVCLCTPQFFAEHWLENTGPDRRQSLY
jgi:hypothetical protein